MTSASPDSARRMVLVTGAPRSGTSTAAGTLHYLGFHVPQPALKGNESNPRGFFESWWPLRFHRGVMVKANIDQTDGRPAASGLMRAAVDDEVRAELDTWLAGVVAASDRVVVKDPRAVWLPWLWVEAAGRQGVRIGFLTMLRHPTEVLGSRQTYYAAGRPHMDAWQFSVWTLCGWINQNLVTERETRGEQRSFVLYHELVEDWRAVMRRVSTELDLRFDDDLDSGAHHEVDDFIDPGLRRHSAGWDDWGLPGELVELAEEAFEALTLLAGSAGHDAAAEAQLDDISARYAELYRQSEAIAYDAINARARLARQAGVSEEKDRRREQKKASADTSAHAPPPESSWRRAYRSAGRRALRLPAVRKARERLRAR